MDGWITIGTELATDKFDRQIVELEKKMQKEEDKKLVINTKLSSQEQELENARKKTDELADAYQRLQTIQTKVAQGKATPMQFQTMQELQNTYGTLEKIGNSFDKALDKQDAIEQKILQTKLQYDDINKKIEEYKQKINTINIQKQKADVDRLKGSIDNVGSSLKKSISNAGKLALSIFGIRSAYLALRRASSDLATYDTQYATNLEYIRFVLTQAVAPILRYIVNLAATLLGYINSIAQAWFGVNIFANSSVEAFNKMKAGASGVGKAVKEIKKQLLGFDEINVLTDQSDTGTSAGAGGVGMPSFDLSGLEGEVPEWLQWIIDHKSEILSILSGIGTALALINRGVGILKATGIGMIITGIVYAIQGLLDYLSNPIFDNFGKIFIGIGIAVAGVGVAFAGLPAIIVGVIITIWGIIVKYWEQIKAFFQGNLDWLKGQTDWVRSIFGDLGANIYENVLDYAQMILDILDDTMNGIKDAFDDVLEFINAVFTGDWETAWAKIQDIATNPIEFLRDLWDNVLGFFRNSLDKFITFLTGKRDWVKQNFGEAILFIYDTFIKNLTIARNILDNFINTMRTNFNNIIAFIKNVFTGNWQGAWENLGNIVTNIFGFIGSTITNILNAIWNVITGWASAIGTAVGDTISNAFRNVVNGILSGVEYILNGPIRRINSLIGVINVIPGVNLSRLSTFSLPRLAVGGIVNMPNTGTLVGGAIAGESGREGVIPLTDAQAMAELGREIGRWITVNASITNTMNGRVISRELKQIQNEQDFAYNT